MHSFFLYLKKAQKEFRTMDSFFPFSEENTKGIQNDGFLFLKKAQMEFRMMDPFFLYLKKA